MGYKLPDGRYVDDQGKTWKNYNDAAAAAKTRQLRAETELELLRQRQLHLHAKNKLEQGQLSKQYFGWVPGLGAAIDRGMQADARAKAEARDAMWALRGKLDIYEARMGEGPMPPTRDLSEGTPPAPSAAPGLGAPVPYGDPAARARKAEQRRMMQQYASKEYWDTEQGKAMLSLGQQMSAPKDAKLADYYGAQRAVGIGSMDEILSGLASVDDRYKEGGDLRKWAQANQGLALREYNKRFPGGVSNDPSMGSTQKGYENAVSTYEAHGAPQESVDAFMAEQQARGKAAFRDMEKYPLAGAAPEQTPPTTPVLQKTAPLVDSGLKGGVVGISALRGAPINNAISPMPDRDARHAIEADYGGGSTPETFVDPATLPNMAFVGNGMGAEPTLTPAREQEVPGITAPFLEPHMIRNSNLRSDALLDRYLTGIRNA